MKRPTRIMLVEDHAGYREVITRALQREETMDLTSQFSSAEFALRELQSAKGETIPDIVLLDLNLPGMSGLEAIPWIKKYSADTKIIILTQSNAEADVLEAIRCGATGYVLKTSKPNQIMESIQTVMDGGAPLDPGVARYLLDTLAHKLPKGSPEVTLSPREQDVLSLLAQGLARKEVSQKLGIRTYTVIYHIKNIFGKLQAVNTPEAISKAYQQGILPTRTYEE